MTIELISATDLVPQLQCETDTGIETQPLAQEVSAGPWQQDIPERYWTQEPA